MSIEPVQVEIHFEEELDATQRSLLETRLEEEGSVVSARFRDDDAHRLILAYDEQRYSQLTLLDAIRELGFHAWIP